jgi:hypothetical protein
MSDTYNNDGAEMIPSQREQLTRMYKEINRYYRFNQNNINRFRTDRKFLFWDQWDQSERQSFRELNKPIFTYNKLYDYYRKLVGEQRFNTSNLEVSAINGIGTQEDITLRADIIRGIEYKSRADIAYQNAFSNAVSGGMGFIKLKTDYISPKSFKQDIFIEMVKYADRVGYDPNAKSPTKTDGNFFFAYDHMDRTDFEQQYPDIPYPQSFPVNYNTIFFNWGDKNGITVVEYYEKKWFNFTLYQLSNGEEISKKDYNKRKKELESPEPEEGANDGVGSGAETYHALETQAMANAIPIPQQPDQSQNNPNMPPNMQQEAPNPIPAQTPEAPPMQPPMMPGVDILPTIVSTRKSRDYKIMCYKAIAGRIIEEYEWPGKEFPFAAVMGDEVVVEGETMITSLVTYAKDPQRFLNFLASDSAQAAKNNRREQFLVTPDNIAGFEGFWKNPANQAGALPYNPDSVTKAAPVQLRIPELPQTLILNMQQADKDLRSIIGYPQEMNDGRQFGQLSGKAIREQQKIGNSSNLVFFDNLNRAQEQIGRAILSMLPRVYDTERTLSTYGVDGKNKQITVNKKAAGTMLNDLSKGEFDIRIDAGASYAVQKEEALQVLMQLASASPNMFPLIADIVAKNIDIEDNIELVNRLKTLVPPDVIAKSEGKPAPPQPPSPQEQAAQMQQQIEQGKLQVSMAKVQQAQQQTQMQAQLNEVKAQQAMIEMQSAKIRAYADLQRGGLDYKAAMVESAAKVAAAHATVHDKHFEAMKHIHDLESPDALQPKEQYSRNPNKL